MLSGGPEGLSPRRVRGLHMVNEVVFQLVVKSKSAQSVDFIPPRPACCSPAVTLQKALGTAAAGPLGSLDTSRPWLFFG